MAEALSTLQLAVLAAKAAEQRRLLQAEPVAPGLKLGARVRHAKFGAGVVLGIEGQGPHARIQVNFEGAGSKWLMLQYAQLEPL